MAELAAGTTACKAHTGSGSFFCRRGSKRDKDEEGMDKEIGEREGKGSGTRDQSNARRAKERTDGKGSEAREERRANGKGQETS